MEEIKKLLEMVLDKAIPNDISGATTLREDLGFDSLKLAHLTVVIEDKYGVDIFEDGNIQFVGDILAKLKSD